MEPDASFQPVFRSDARILILGSLPGKRSIAEQRYYAHPRNSFWSILESITGAKADQSYSQRISALLASKIALWDVVQQADRPGSLDSSIRKATVHFNPIPTLLEQCPGIALIVFNGAEAESLFRRAEKRECWQISCEQLRLPSTSPANAALSVEEKRKQWITELTRFL